MKNYLLFSLIGLCISPNIQSAECRELQEERLQKERLEEELFIATFGEQSLASQLAHVDKSKKALREKDPVLESELDTIQALIDEFQTSIDKLMPLKDKKAEIIAKIMFLEATIRNGIENRRQRDRANTKLKKLNDLSSTAQSTFASLEHARKAAGGTLHVSMSKDDQDHIKATLEQSWRSVMSLFAQMCDENLNPKYQKITACPNHGATTIRCEAIPHKSKYKLVEFPMPDLKKLPYKLLTEEVWDDWYYKDLPLKPLKLKILAVLRKSNGFENLGSQEHIELVENLKKVFAYHTWTCDCSKK